MPQVTFHDLMMHAEGGQYAVGYFECWNLESLLAVADAAEATRSPVILGVSGIYLPRRDRVVQEPLSLYATMGLEICRQLSVPACLLFNECPDIDWVLEAIQLGFGLVMYTDDCLSFGELTKCVSQVVQSAHQSSVAVEGEFAAVPGVGGELSSLPGNSRPTDPEQARSFVKCTGVDALAVNVGQAHLHGRKKVRLNLSRLADLQASISVPMVLHGASSVGRSDMQEAIRLGIRKINVGSVLKSSFFEAVRTACGKVVGDDYNPYETLGSGLEADVLAVGRLALQETVEDLMRLFGSAGKAW
jgi:fructose-bisphosphate aldolase class II